MKLLTVLRTTDVAVRPKQNTRFKKAVISFLDQPEARIR
jgi:hypothetical protein